MPKPFPREFCEDVIRVFRGSDASMTQVARAWDNASHAMYPATSSTALVVVTVPSAGQLGLSAATARALPVDGRASLSGTRQLQQLTRCRALRALEVRRLTGLN